MRRFAFSLFLASLSAGCALAPGDPAVSDPPRRLAIDPASMDGTVIESHGARMFAAVYGAAGPGPHPTLILLHGFPGNERNLDLAQAVRRAGWNAIFFTYRGAWGSEGDFSFSNALADVGAAVAFAQSPAYLEAWRGDPSRIALLGHSMGGFMALTAGSALPAVDCIGSLAGANLGFYAAAPEEVARGVAARLEGWRGPLRGTTGQVLVEEVRSDPQRFDLLRRVPALVHKPLLLVAGNYDVVTVPAEHHDPLVAALQGAGPISLRVQRLDADHAFTSRRIALARSVIAWLEDDCLP